MKLKILHAMVLNIMYMTIVNGMSSDDLSSGDRDIFGIIIYFILTLTLPQLCNSFIELEKAWQFSRHIPIK